MGKLLERLVDEGLEAVITRSVQRALQLNNMAAAEVKKITGPRNPIAIERAMQITSLSRQTIYYKVSKKQIPYVKRGKRLQFFEEELLEWIKGESSEVIMTRREKEVFHG